MNASVLQRRLAAVVGGTLLAGMAVVATATPAVNADPTCTATWIGAAGASWTRGSNWRPHAVPTAASQVCITTVAGPRITADVDAVAFTLTISRSSVLIDGTLTVASFDITTSSLSGVGAIQPAGSGLPSALSGVQMDGSLAVSAHPPVLVHGPRQMCGARLVLCLNGASRLTVLGNLDLADGDIGGDTSAAPALLLRRGGSLRAVTGTTGAEYANVLVPMSAAGVENRTDAGHPVVLDVSAAWNQPGPDGSFTAILDNEYGLEPIVLSRSITSISGGHIRGDGGRTPTFDAALSTLTNISDGRVTLLGDVRMTPPSGTLSVSTHSTLEIAQGTHDVVGTLWVTDAQSAVDVEPSATFLVIGSITNAGSVSAAGTLLGGMTNAGGNVDVSGVLDTGDFTFRQTGGATTIGPTGTAHARNVSIAAGTLLVDGTLDPTKGPIRLVDGASLLHSHACAVGNLAGSVYLDPAAAVRVQLGSCAQVFAADGPVVLPRILNISHSSGAVGTSVVVLDSSAGVTGRFTKITGADVGSNHWVISYTATEVIATLVAGHV